MAKTKASDIKVPDLSLSSLRALYQQAQQAAATYNLALNATVAALGLDPRQPNKFDLDTGIITPAAPEQDAK